MTTTLPALPGPVTDVDVSIDGTWVAACDSAMGPMICTAQAQFSIPMLAPGAIVRVLPSHDILLIEPRTSTWKENAAVVSPQGEVRFRFSVGDGVLDALVVGDRVVCSYFDEGVLGGGALSANGVCVFSDSGDMLLGYHADVEGAIAIADCYCIAPVGEEEVCFSPYTDFQLVMLNIRTGAQRVHDLPERLHGCNALSSIGSGFHLHDPHAARTELFHWTPSEEPAAVGTHAGRLRGLRGGEFITATRDGYAILRASPA